LLTATSVWAYKTRAQDTLFDSYVGIHAEKYRLAQELLHSRSGKLIWNWPAALLGPVWLYYRKLFIPLSLWLMLCIIFDFIFFANQSLVPTTQFPLRSTLVNHYLLLSILFTLISNSIIGGWGTYFYLRRVEHIIETVRTKTPASIAAALLAEKGAPSYWRLVGGFLLIITTFLLTYLAAQLFMVHFRFPS
jgi:hypothetical protein